MRHLLQLARKDPPKTAGLTLLATLAISALLLYVAYLRSPPASAPKTIAIYSTKPTTKPTTRESPEMLADSLIIQANSAQLEQRRLAIEQSRAARSLGFERNRLNTGRRPNPEPRTLERLFRLRPPAAPAAVPATSPTTRPAP